MEDLTQSRDEAHAKASEEASCGEQGQCLGRGLEDDAKGKDAGGNDQTQTTTNRVTKRCGGQSSEEGAGGKNGDDLGGLGGADVKVTLGINVSGGEFVFPVGHGQNAGDGTCIISTLIATISASCPSGQGCESGGGAKGGSQLHAYPKRTPPKATNMPIKMAGHDFPASFGGLFSRIPMLAVGEGKSASQTTWLSGVIPQQARNPEGLRSCD